MNAPTITREQAYAEARRALDEARARRDRDRAAGRLAPEAELILRRLERQQRQQAPAVEHRDAA
ncbi:hypothetical protein ABZT26_12920 [Streptomyces sp. NPDC005395]|uniref:hypothetical protein n=1 Tax=Streptomyces sp. NPDC005395 TaxID=3157042 RepID=UPI0033AC0303